MAAIAGIIAQLIWISQFVEPPPFVLLDFVRATAAVPAMLGIIQLGLQPTATVGRSFLRWARPVQLALLIVGGWVLLDGLVDQMVTRSRAAWLEWQSVALPTYPYRHISDFARFGYLAIGWVDPLARGLIQLPLFGLLVSLVRSGALDWRWLKATVAAAPIRWVTCSVAIVIVTQALMWLIQLIMQNTGASSLLEMSSHDWRKMVPPLLVYEAAYYPFAIAGYTTTFMLARAFAHVIGSTEQRSPDQLR